jgi:hypothetical protein
VPTTNDHDKHREQQNPVSQPSFYRNARAAPFILKAAKPKIWICYTDSNGTTPSYRQMAVEIAEKQYL